MESGRDSLSLTWRPYVAGNGAVEQSGDILSFVTRNTSAGQYTDAQVDDYQGLRRRRFRWRPPVTLTVRARFSHPAGSLRGTAGFGFWNDPFLMTGARLCSLRGECLPALPRATWFFYASAPSDMRLDRSTPGCGWKAATIDASRPKALLLAPLAPFAVLLMNSPSLFRRLWPRIQRALAVREAALVADMTDWHEYTIEWGVGQVHFGLDGECVLRDAPSPRGPLGFVMWLDNQYMVVTPQGRLGWGLLDVAGIQQMQADRIEISAFR